MIVKILRYSALALTAIACCSCQKEPSTSDLRKEYLVYTAHDTATDFQQIETYYMPDRILVLGHSDRTEYWKDDDAREILAVVADQMNAAGYTRLDDRPLSDVRLHFRYVQRVTHFAGYDNHCWRWYSHHSSTPGYWGDWAGWHYPYSVYYGYTAGSLLMEMVDLEADRQSGKKLPVIWDSFIGGLLTSNEALNLERTLDAVEQAFTQSPYLSTK